MGPRNSRRLQLESLSPRLLLAGDAVSGIASEPVIVPSAPSVAETLQLAPPLAVPAPIVEAVAAAPHAPSPVLSSPTQPQPDWLRSVPVKISPATLAPPHGSFPGTTLPPIDVAQRLASPNAAIEDIQLSKYQPFPTESRDDRARQFFVGDFDGDGCNELAGFIDGRWWVDRNGDGALDEQDAWAQFGDCSDSPFVADVDGDGKDEFGVRTTRGEVRIAEVRRAEDARLDAPTEPISPQRSSTDWEIAERTIATPMVAQVEISRRR